ncbi:MULTISPECIES: fimbrial biogenesis chaperone [Pseudomonas aeruginosa group]|uniref:fimbrial biogenesis chaperone n=1 Tax=Pseudomonas aeruginosa group TaxID=136841 RepID=UPI00210A56EB|nr:MULTISPECIES: molecular chaperone [Pseudomonas aeruginosa group]MCR3764222.1 molecular chaperone [Pseudomonas aeruginosa]MCW8025442.1 molecular chaperone [Pseudomonas aeruginosa]MDY1576305.1 molecular chaperone [Pseudomonas paraeruginosa]UYT18750.1 chaperone CupB4 [Pseudomonas aeruginosa]HBO7424695.1 molecular chaperone [Pseudomonas aeruginosa]
MIRRCLHRCGLALGLSLVLPASADAALNVVGSRFIYPAQSEALSIRIGNGGQRPILVQAWLDRGDGSADPSTVQVPFVLSRPLSRVEPQEKYALQLRYTGEPLPDDRESLFWLNLLEVPSRDEGRDNLLLLSYRLRMKVLFRPRGLPGDPRAAAGQVAWRLLPAASPGKLAVLEADNRSPYHVSLTRLELREGDVAIALGHPTLPPFSRTPLPLPKPARAGARVHYEVVDDQGRIEVGVASTGPPVAEHP